jgi:hypothetical protein
MTTKGQPQTSQQPQQHHDEQHEKKQLRPLNRRVDDIDRAEGPSGERNKQRRQWEAKRGSGSLLGSWPCALDNADLRPESLIQNLRAGLFPEKSQGVLV